MKKAIMEKWVKALRSGKYRQTKSGLHKKGGGYCCLGVLCDLYAKEKKLKKPWFSSPESAPNFLSFQGANGYPPLEVQEWAGLETHCGELPSGETLAGMNDDGKRFTTIAKTIEFEWMHL